MKLFTSIVRTAAFGIAAASLCFAQDAPSVRAKTIELGTFVGASYGLENFRVMGGGNLGYGLSKVFFLYGEVSYLPGIQRSTTVPDSSIPQKFDIPMTDFNAGLHIRYPNRGRRFVPYGIIGAGMIHSGDSTVNYSLPQASGPPKPGSFDILSSNDYATNFGGGVRIYIKERFGFRFEAKAYKPTGRFTDLFSRYAGGLFFQFQP